MINYMFFLIMLMPNTDQPVMVVMQAYTTAKECNDMLRQAPAESRDKFKCIAMTMNPENEREVKKL